MKTKDNNMKINSETSALDSLNLQPMEMNSVNESSLNYSGNYGQMNSNDEWEVWEVAAVMIIIVCLAYLGFLALRSSTSQSSQTVAVVASTLTANQLAQMMQV